jgi:hypothetical protein
MSAPELVDHLLLPVETEGGIVLARAHFPAAEGDTLPQIAGFVQSSFSPLVAEVADRCLRARHGEPPAVPEHAGSTALVLASARGDTTTNETAQDTAGAGGRVPPLLFFQSNPNAVLGWVAARWQLDGPVLSIAPAGDLMADAQHVAGLLMADGEAAEVLVIVAELDPDRAEAVLLGSHRKADLILPDTDPVTTRPEVVPARPEVGPAGNGTGLVVPDAGTAGTAVATMMEGHR